MKKLCAVIIAAAVVSGCADQDAASLLASQHQVIQYNCGSVPLLVTFDNINNRASLLIEGRLRTLPLVEAASGAKYDDGQFTFWSKGNQATVFKGDQILLADCVSTQ